MVRTVIGDELERMASHPPEGSAMPCATGPRPSSRRVDLPDALSQRLRRVRRYSARHLATRLHRRPSDSWGNGATPTGNRSGCERASDLTPSDVRRGRRSGRCSGRQPPSVVDGVVPAGGGAGSGVKTIFAPNPVWRRARPLDMMEPAGTKSVVVDAQRRHHSSHRNESRVR